MPTTHAIDATLGEGFKVRLKFVANELDEPDKLDVLSLSTGESLEPLIFGTRLWDEAWNAADRHLASLPLSPIAHRARALQVAEACHDTPYR